MNNQLLIDELRELAEVMRDYAEESRSVGSQRLESYYVGKAVAFEEVISMIESSPVPAIGCSECDYKGYFEYETGVVDEGTRIKEIAKEPCDCVIDRVPTIKPGDTTKIKLNCRECDFECVVQYDSEVFVDIDEGHCPHCGNADAVDLEVIRNE